MFKSNAHILMQGVSIVRAAGGGKMEAGQAKKDAKIS
jgi:hypothetical protein